MAVIFDPQANLKKVCCVYFIVRSFFGSMSPDSTSGSASPRQLRGTRAPLAAAPRPAAPAPRPPPPSPRRAPTDNLPSWELYDILRVILRDPSRPTGPAGSSPNRARGGGDEDGDGGGVWVGPLRDVRAPGPAHDRRRRPVPRHRPQRDAPPGCPTGGRRPGTGPLPLRCLTSPLSPHGSRHGGVSKGPRRCPYFAGDRTGRAVAAES